MSNARNLAQTAVVSQRSRNRVDNGDMSVWQRPMSGTFYNVSSPVDRWFATYATSSGNPIVLATSRYNTDGPSYEMPTSARWTTTTAATAIVEFCARHYMEVNTIRDLIGKKVVLSFWYKSNRTGQHTARLITTQAVGSTGGQDIILPFTVNTANTWEYKSVQLDGFLALANWGTGDGSNLGAIIDIGWRSGNYGSASCAANDYFQITGVQLEKGMVPTAFEFLTPAENLVRCQRYVQFRYSMKFWGYSNGDQALGGPITFSPMRSNPTVVMGSQAYGNCRSLTAEQIMNSQISVYALANATGNLSFLFDLLLYSDFA